VTHIKQQKYCLSPQAPWIQYRVLIISTAILAFRSNYVRVLYQFGDKTKVAMLLCLHTPAFDAPVSGVPVRILP